MKPIENQQLLTFKSYTEQIKELRKIFELTQQKVDLYHQKQL